VSEVVSEARRRTEARDNIQSLRKDDLRKKIAAGMASLPTVRRTVAYQPSAS